MALKSSKSIIEAVMQMMSSITYPVAAHSSDVKKLMVALDTGDEIGASITKQNQATGREESDTTRPPRPRIGVRVADVVDPENTESHGQTLIDRGLNTLRGLPPLPLICTFTLNVYSQTNYQLFPIWAALQFRMHPKVPIVVKDDESGDDIYLRKTNVRQRPKTAPFSVEDSPQAIMDFSVPFWQLTTEPPEVVVRHEQFNLTEITITGEGNG